MRVSLLPQCDGCICHGGQNTMIQSLVYGVPLLILPGPIFERRFNAGQVQKAGAGYMGELPDFNSAWLQTAFLKQKESAAQAAALGQKINSLGGARQAVEAINNWLVV
ncbi:MAG: hypothetical protein LWX83_02690 [Anaerolineae bacterium]|nr:hypothetical protein [Anaerolineae bacterium]